MAFIVLYISSQFEGGWIRTVPDGEVVLRAGCLGLAFVRPGDASASFSSSSSSFLILRGEIIVLSCVVSVSVTTLAFSGLSTPNFLFLLDRGGVATASSISVVGEGLSLSRRVEVSSSSFTAPGPSYPSAKDASRLEVLVVRPFCALGESAEKIRVVSCEIRDVRIVILCRTNYEISFVNVGLTARARI
jgi:hypothetical protein